MPVAVGRPKVNIPLIERAPTFEDFPDMAPNDFAARMAHAERFTESQPSDGAPASQTTDAYMGYDAKNLYVTFVCRDDHPEQIRARMTRRENAFDDDYVQITLDTFRDQRRGFVFFSNPLGIEADALWSESNGEDWSFDTVFNVEGKLTPKGYIVNFAIPFRSLRFSPAELQTWGLTLQRRIPRNNEMSFWPRVSSNVTGRLNQAADIAGISKVSPGRNMQFIPYGIARSYRALDERAAVPRFAGETIAGDIGLDSKIVIKDRLVLDATINPDFSQVESDEPQVTVNQRFEVFFPEKRPFFLENASYFSTPLDLSFTRRIIDPDYGVRLTGKVGGYAIGALFADDASPGKSVPRGDPLDGTKAYFGIFRVNRDWGKQNTIGAIYADREYHGAFNRVGGLDLSWRAGSKWSGHFQGLESSTRNDDGTYQAGPAFTAYAQRQSQQTRFEVRYTDVGVGYVTHTGFFQRPDIRRFATVFGYAWRPEGKHLISFGPLYHGTQIWDHRGLNVMNLNEFNFDVTLRGNTAFGFWGGGFNETLRPLDYPGLPRPHTFDEGYYSFYFDTEYLKKIGFHAFYNWEHDINFGAVGGVPTAGNRGNGNVTLTVRPVDKLVINNTYLYWHLVDPFRRAGVFNQHTLRSKWNYQINKQLSVRAIAQYDGLLANPLTSVLTPTKGLSGDFLITYLVHPGTAIYAGYNSHLSTLDPSLTRNGNGDLLQTRNSFINDGRVVFVKLSYLFRF